MTLSPDELGTDTVQATPLDQPASTAATASLPSDYLSDTALTPLQVLQRFRPHDGTLTDFFASRCERQADLVFMQFDDRTWTWAQTVADAAHVAQTLASHGVGTGDRVLVSGVNSAWHVLCLLACAQLGAIFVPVNPAFKTEELAYVVSHAEPAVIVCDAQARTAVNAVLAKGSRGCAVLGLDAGLLTARPDTVAVVSSASEHATNTSPDTPCVMIYTSGTTGFPKGVLHSHHNLVLAGEAFVERLHLQPDERMFLILPMFHINALFYSVAGAMAAGATLLIEPRFSASAFWQRVVALQATQVNVIEAIVSILLSRADEEYIPGHTLRKIYGVRQGSVQRFTDRFQVPILIGGYAMTEIPGVLSTPFDRPMRPNSMGVLCKHPDPDYPWAQCRIVDDAGQPVAQGETGELQVKTPILMLGYFRDDEQTRASFQDGWFMTGDLVKADADGFYYFVSRKKDIIRRRGENIAGQELDRIVAEHPDVLLAAAIGVPSSFGDEDILVAVTPKPGVTLLPADIITWCRDRLTPIKVPRYVSLVDNMPLTPTHKVAKAQLKKDSRVIDNAVDFEK